MYKFLGEKMKLSRRQLRRLIFEEAGELKMAMHFEQMFRTKLEKQKTANITGPRMVVAGPFALK